MGSSFFGIGRLGGAAVRPGHRTCAISRARRPRSGDNHDGLPELAPHAVRQVLMQPLGNTLGQRGYEYLINLPPVQHVPNGLHWVRASHLTIHGRPQLAEPFETILQPLVSLAVSTLGNEDIPDLPRCATPPRTFRGCAGTPTLSGCDSWNEQRELTRPFRHEGPHRVEQIVLVQSPIRHHQDASHHSPHASRVSRSVPTTLRPYGPRGQGPERWAVRRTCQHRGSWRASLESTP
jgi:hypothetical protein